MSNNTEREGHSAVYEIGYLIASSIPEEKVPEESAALNKIVFGYGSSMIAEEPPRLMPLAYTMSAKTVSGSYSKYNQAYFGWIKFELGSDRIEALKKDFEKHPSLLRMILISTVAENTFLGKRATAIASVLDVKKPISEGKIYQAKEKELTTPISITEMDKSIDEMVKEI